MNNTKDSSTARGPKLISIFTRLLRSKFANGFVNLTAILGIIAALFYSFEIKEFAQIILVLLYPVSLLISLVNLRWPAALLGLMSLHGLAAFEWFEMSRFGSAELHWLFALISFVWVFGVLARKLGAGIGYLWRIPWFQPNDFTQNLTLYIALSSASIMLWVALYFPLATLSDPELAQSSMSEFAISGRIYLRSLYQAFTDYAPLLWLIYLVTGFLNLISRQWRALFFGLAPGHLVALASAGFHQYVGGETVLIWLWLPAALTGLGWFVVEGRVISKTIGVILLLIWFFTGFLYALLFLLLCVFLRYLLLAWSQNWPIFRDFGLRHTTRTLLMSMWFAAPLYVVGYLGFTWVSSIQEYSFARLSCMTQGNDDINTCVTRLTNSEDFWAEAEKVTIAATRQYINSRSDMIDSWKNRGNTRIGQGKEYAKTQILNGYNEIIPKANEIPALRDQPCGFWDLIPCSIANGIRSSIRSKYDDARTKKRKELKLRLDEIKTPDLDTGANFLKEKMVTVEKSSTAALRSIFQANRMVGLISIMLLLLVGLRSFLYIFARVAFAGDSKVFISLRDDKADMNRGAIKLAGSEYLIDLAREGSIYAARKYQPQGQAPRFSLPQPGILLLARIVNGAWAMNFLRASQTDTKVKFSIAQGQEFVVWSLKEGEVVVFNFKQFVAMSSSIQLASLISLRITSILFGKIIFATAKGPGKLILKSFGRAGAITTKDGIGGSVAPNRLLAWQKNARFSIESNLSFADVYLSGFYLRPEKKDPVLIDVDRQETQETGLGRFVKHFIKPW